MIASLGQPPTFKTSSLGPGVAFFFGFPTALAPVWILEFLLRADFGRGVSSRVKREGATEVAPSIETVARCDGASSLALAGYLSFGLSANLALSERYAAVAVKGKQGVRGYPQAGYLRLINLRTS